jgi:hypothetical protein
MKVQSLGHVEGNETVYYDFSSLGLSKSELLRIHDQNGRIPWENWSFGIRLGYEISAGVSGFKEI